jgi:DNA-binding MarR family transcriptional regulator
MEKSNLDSIIESIFSIKPILSKNLVYPVRQKLMISTGTHYVLSILEKEGPLTMTDISRKLVIPKPNVTPLIDKLIELGYVERLADEHDRRIVKVKITGKGIDVIDELRNQVSEYIKQKLSIFNDNELDELCSALKTVNLILSRLGNGS